MQHDTKKPLPWRKSRWGILSTLTVGLLLILAVLELTNTTHFLHKAKPSHDHPATPTIGGATDNNQKGEVSQTNSSALNTPSVPGDTGQPGDSKSSTSGTSTAALISPSGDFVSAHGDSAHPITLDTTLSSVCNTTPGATCQIIFTKNGNSEKLQAQLTDRGGSTYWNSWTPRSIGLTGGQWQIQAIATLNGQTKTAADAMDLVVAP